LRLKLLSTSKFSVLISLVVYMTSFILGWTLTLLLGSTSEMSADEIGQSNLTAISYITHNIGASTPLYFGILSFGLVTLAFIVFDGFTFGSIAAESLGVIGIYKVLILTMPHGIFELPATILAGAAGFKSLEVLIRHLRGGTFFTRHDVKDYFKLAVASIILMIIAGIVEANITYRFAVEH
jgi:stage II sporulation protein M